MGVECDDDRRVQARSIITRLFVKIDDSFRHSGRINVYDL